MFSRAPLLVFAACVLPRLGYLLLVDPHPEPTLYSGLAGPLPGRSGPEVLHQTMIEPAYPLLLAAARWLLVDARLVLAAQIAIAAVGGVWLHRLATTLTGDRRAGAFAAAFYALDPFLVRQAANFMEVSTLTTLLIGTAYYASRTSAPAAVALGGVAGLAVLTRFSVAPIALAALAIVFWRRPRTGIVAAACAALLVGSWVARMQALNGAVVPTRLGSSLYTALSPEAEQIGPTVNWDVLSEYAYAKGSAAVGHRGLSLVEHQRAQDEFLLSESLRFAREHPWRALRLKLRHFLHVFNPRLLPYERLPEGQYAQVVEGRVLLPRMEPRPVWEDVVHATWRTLLLALALAGIWLRGIRRDDAVLWATVVTVALVQTIFSPTTRLTTPMVFVWMFFAAVAAARLLRGSSEAAPTRR
ncbi:MAG TPA: hypothetical protein VM364_11595 [Vicinamibacterales bacterium]|nr:hypothetical protein [Vicinamibacterales bacterium]